MSASTQALQHMPGCRRDAEDGDAFMADERHWTSMCPEPHIDSLLAGSLLRALEKAARDAGAPFERISESRWNDAGEPIGPRLEVRVCELVDHRELCRLVSIAIEGFALRMVEARGIGS